MRVKEKGPFFPALFSCILMPKCELNLFLPKRFQRVGTLQQQILIESLRLSFFFLTCRRDRQCSFPREHRRKRTRNIWRRGENEMINSLFHDKTFLELMGMHRKKLCFASSLPQFILTEYNLPVPGSSRILLGTQSRPRLQSHCRRCLSQRESSSELRSCLFFC